MPNPLGAPDTIPGAPLPEPPAPTPAKPKRGGRKAPSGTTRKTVESRDTTPRGAGRPSVKSKLSNDLDDVIVSIALAVGLVNEADGAAIAAGSSKLADSLAAVADANPRVMKALQRTTSAAGWGGVALALSGILIPIAANHGLIPGAPAGLDLPPDVMAQMAEAAQAMVDGMNPDQMAQMMAAMGGTNGPTA